MAGFYKFLQLYTPYIVLPLSILGLLLILVSRIYTQILINYLKINKPNQWEELAEINILGPTLYGINTFKRFRYIFGTVDDDDQRIFKLKIKTRNFLKLGLLLFIGAPIFFFVLFSICVFSGQR